MNRSITLIVYFAMVIPLFACATTHQITSGNTNQCMNVVNHGYPVPGTPVHVKQCDPWQNQQWAFNNGNIVGVGGFLGAGEKDVSVPFDAVRITTKDNNKWYLVMNTTKDELKNASGFTYDKEATTWVPDKK